MPRAHKTEWSAAGRAAFRHSPSSKGRQDRQGETSVASELACLSQMSGRQVSDDVFDTRTSHTKVVRSSVRTELARLRGRARGTLFLTPSATLQGLPQSFAPFAFLA